ncbi:hypothetical protein Phage2-1_00099 [Achromobacter phage 2-1]|nr:hypothetical protein Phage2-1_00099 [Achromobacter phage 2-1]
MTVSNAMFLVAQAINEKGVVIWQANEGTDGVTDINLALRNRQPSAGYYGFTSAYILPMCRMIADASGHVYLKALLQLPEALVAECLRHDELVAATLEDLPPGKFEIGQLAYYEGRLAKIEGLKTSISYSASSKKESSVTYEIMTHDNSYTAKRLSVSECELQVLPLNEIRDMAMHQLPGAFAGLELATLVPVVVAEEEVEA